MKKLFFVIALIVIAVAMVACAVENTPSQTASEATQTVQTETGVSTEAQTQPTATEATATSSVTETTAPIDTTEPVQAKTGHALSGSVIETEDKIFFTSNTFGISLRLLGSCYHYYSKTDGEMHVFCADPDCDHKNFDGTTYTPKCAACLISDPLCTPYDGIWLVNYGSRIYFSNFGELYSANEDGGDLRLELSLSAAREPYEELAKHPENIVASGSKGSVLIKELTNDGSDLYFTAQYLIGYNEYYKFNADTKELTDLTEKKGWLEEKTGRLMDFYAFRDGKIYVQTYHREKTADNPVGRKITESGVWEITGDFEDIVRADDSIRNLYTFDTEEGKYLEDVYSDSLVLIKENGEKEVVLENLRQMLGGKDCSIEFSYIDDDYIYYTIINSAISRNRMNISKVMQLKNTYYNDAYGLLMRYDRKIGEKAANTDGIILSYEGKEGTRTELYDRLGLRYGYSELYDITVGKEPYYIQKISDDGTLEKELLFGSYETVTDVIGYTYYPVDKNRTMLIELINNKTLKQEIDDGVSYNDTSVYYVDPLTNHVYLLFNSTLSYDESKTLSDTPIFDYKTSACEDNIPYATEAVINNFLLDNISLMYIDYENGTALIKADEFVPKTGTDQNGNQTVVFNSRTRYIKCDIDGAGMFVNLRCIFSEEGETGPGSDFEPYGISNAPGCVKETKDAVYFFPSSQNKSSHIASYYYKYDGKLHPLCADPNCDHVVFDGKEVHATCPAAMISDVYGSFSGENGTTPIFANSRIYFVFFQEIYSCNEFGGDLRLEVSLDKERGQYDKALDVSEPSACEIEKIRIYDVISGGGAIYFKYKTVRGDVVEYKYDTFTKELVDITDKNVAPLRAEHGFMLKNTYSDGTPFVVKINSNGETEVVVDEFDPARGARVYLAFLSDEYIYYYKIENVSVGKYFGISGDTSINYSSGKLLRYDIKTGETTTVLSDIKYDEFEILSIDGENKTALLHMTCLEKNGNRIKKTAAEYICDIADDGRFVRIRKVEMISS